jgi:hypothetical protein
MNRLFPGTGRGNKTTEELVKENSEQQRICTLSVFDKYFSFMLPDE